MSCPAIALSQHETDVDPRLMREEHDHRIVYNTMDTPGEAGRRGQSDLQAVC